MTIRVMLVDDSATVRTVLKMILEKDPDITVIGVAATPDIALRKMQKDWPDVIVSDLEMPGMHGLDFLRYIREHRPTPFVVCSSHVGPGAQASLDALALGAVDIITKPNISIESSLDEITASITQSVKAAAQSALATRPTPTGRAEAPAPRVPAPTSTPAAWPVSKHATVIAIGSSTGGTVIVEQLLRSMGKHTPGTVVVQHMPKHFTGLFAKRLNGICDIDVLEARDGDAILPGRALIAPGGEHVSVTQHVGGGLCVRIDDSPPVNRHRPSVDVLFRSVARVVGNKAVGIILTGMGEDGAHGLLEMRKAGAMTLGQDQASSAVYGMPRVAMDIGAVEQQMPASAMPEWLQRAFPASNTR